MAAARSREVSAGGVVVREDPDGPRVLLICDSYRNWGFPKGHLESGEHAEAAAVREVSEETGLTSLELLADVQTIDWHFRFRGRLVHKVCHFFLMRTIDHATTPQAAEGITACRWVPFDEADRLISYENARQVLHRAHGILASLAPRDAGAPTVARQAAPPAP